MSNEPGLSGLTRLFAGEGGLEWGMLGLTGFFLHGDAATTSSLALFVTYLPMVVSAVLLTVLSVAKRARGWQVVTVGLLVAAGLFPVVGCWMWGGGWLARLGSTLQRGHGVVDYAGSGVAYLLGGCTAMGSLIGFGHRLPKATSEDRAEMPPAHFPLLANLGALLFGLGWLGWSLSTPFHAVDAELQLPRIAVNGLLAGAGSALVSQAYCWFTTGKADALMSARGLAAGFVAIAAGAPFVPPWAALVIGAVAGLLLPLTVFVVEQVLRLPDATATIALGLTAGVWGLPAVAFFADGRSGQGWNGVGPTEYHTVAGQGVTGFLPAPGFVGDGRGQMIAQLAGLGAIVVASLLISGLVSLVLSLPYRSRAAKPAGRRTAGLWERLRERMRTLQRPAAGSQEELDETPEEYVEET